MSVISGAHVLVYLDTLGIPTVAADVPYPLRTAWQLRTGRIRFRWSQGMSDVFCLACGVDACTLTTVVL